MPQATLPFFDFTFFRHVFRVLSSIDSSAGNQAQAFFSLCVFLGSRHKEKLEKPAASFCPGEKRSSYQRPLHHQADFRSGGFGCGVLERGMPLLVLLHNLPSYPSGLHSGNLPVFRQQTSKPNTLQDRPAPKNMWAKDPCRDCWPFPWLDRPGSLTESRGWAVWTQEQAGARNRKRKKEKKKIWNRCSQTRLPRKRWT